MHDPDNRVYGLALRGFSGAGQNMYIYPSHLPRLRRRMVRRRKRLASTAPAAVKALDWYVKR